MRQVPYLIIGNGRLAQHLVHYFTLKNVSFFQWTRTQSQKKLRQLSKKIDKVLLAISDQAIENFIIENSFLKQKQIIHFSGCLSTPLAFSAHPLMSFSRALFKLTVYEKIPFILEKEGLRFHDLFPMLKNPAYYIPKIEKSYYHSLCVLSGNFSVLLWLKFMNECSSRYQIPPQATKQYMKAITKNLIHNPQAALTGPLVRKDIVTIEKNLQALKKDPFKGVYQAFVEAYHEKRT